VVKSDVAHKPSAAVGLHRPRCSAVTELDSLCRSEELWSSAARSDGLRLSAVELLDADADASGCAAQLEDGHCSEEPLRGTVG